MFADCNRAVNLYLVEERCRIRVTELGHENALVKPIGYDHEDLVMLLPVRMADQDSYIAVE